MKIVIAMILLVAGILLISESGLGTDILKSLETLAPTWLWTTGPGV